MLVISSFVIWLYAAVIAKDSSLIVTTGQQGGDDKKDDDSGSTCQIKLLLRRRKTKSSTTGFRGKNLIVISSVKDSDLDFLFLEQRCFLRRIGKAFYILYRKIKFLCLR